MEQLSSLINALENAPLPTAVALLIGLSLYTYRSIKMRNDSCEKKCLQLEKDNQALGWVSSFTVVEHNGQPFVMYLASIEQLDRFNGKHHLVAGKSGKSLDSIPAWAKMADGRDLHRWLGQ